MATSYRNKDYREGRVARMLESLPYSPATPDHSYYIQSHGGYGSPRLYQVTVLDKKNSSIALFPRYKSLPLADFGNYVDGMIEALEVREDIVREWPDLSCPPFRYITPHSEGWKTNSQETE